MKTIAETIEQAGFSRAQVGVLDEEGSYSQDIPKWLWPEVYIDVTSSLTTQILGVTKKGLKISIERLR